MLFTCSVRDPYVIRSFMKGFGCYSRIFEGIQVLFAHSQKDLDVICSFTMGFGW